jgi:hypothetical protein
MQCQSVKSKALAKDAIVLPLAVTDISNDGPRKVFEMATDLMSAAGVRDGLNQAVALEGS